ncbi:MAG: hypothetical protein AAF576_00335 [Pseudomonadota bacterium]
MNGLASAAFAACLLATPSLAERWRIEGTTLHFDTEFSDSAAGIERADVDTLRGYLRDNASIAKVSLNSSGGGLYAALDMADVLTDFEVDTEIEALCESSCMYMFLGGATRTMKRGARVGFHRISWSAESIEGYYERNRADEGWTTPFELSSWIYEDTQLETYQIMSFMIRRGVDAAFAVETFNAGSDDMWAPYRQDLLAAGVLTE